MPTTQTARSESSMSPLRLSDDAGGWPALPLLEVVNGLRADGTPIRLAFGTVTFNWANQIQAQASANHGLGVTPAATVATLRGAAQGQFALLIGRTATTITVVANTPTAWTGALAADWLAIG